MSEIVIKIKNLSRYYDEFLALNDISFQVKKGQIFGYLGPNGSGKTTTIKVILGLIKPSIGEVETLQGNLFPDTNKGLQLRSKVGSMLEFNGLIEDLSGLDNLIFWAGLYGINKEVALFKASELIEKVNLNEWKDVKVSKFSYGMKKRLALARSLISDPPLLILDEPTMGIDPESRHLIREILLDLTKEGKTIFFSSHDLEEVQKICSHIAIIKKGKLVFNGQLTKLVENYGISKLYVRLKSIDNAQKLSFELKKKGYEPILDGELVIFYPDESFKIDDFHDYGIIDTWKGESSLEKVYLEMMSEPKA
jgi:ABC-type multidrug transport system ATPase subunit